MRYKIFIMFFVNISYYCTSTKALSLRMYKEFDYQFHDNTTAENLLSIFVFEYPSSTDKFKEVKILEPLNQDAGVNCERFSAVDVFYKEIEGTETIIQSNVIPKGKKLEQYIPCIHYYAVNAYIKQIPSLKQVVFLAFVDDIMFPDKKAYKSANVVFDKDDFNYYNNFSIDKNDLKKFSFTIVELPKFNVSSINDLKTFEERMLYTLKYSDKPLSDEELNKFNRDSMFDLIPVVHKVFSPELESKHPMFNILRRAYSDLILEITAYPETTREKMNNKQVTLLFAKHLLAAGIPKNEISDMTGLSDDEVDSLFPQRR